jgi:hypothetical protein
MGNKISKAFPHWNFTLNIFNVVHKTVGYAVGEQFNPYPANVENIVRAPNNARKWQLQSNTAFKGLNVTGAPCLYI